MSSINAEEIIETTNRAISSFFDNNKFSLDSLNGWKTSLHFGKDYNYRPRDVIPQKSYELHISAMVFKENGTIIITVMQITGNESLLVDSYQINKSRVEVDVRDKLAGALTKIGLTSLPQLMQIRLIRNLIIKNLPVKEFLRMENCCKLLNDICKTKETDSNYWKRKLKEDYDKEKEGIYSSYREAYKHEFIQKKKKSPDNHPHMNPLLVYDPLRDDRSYFPRPRPNPLYPDPSIPNPFAPGVDPNGPFFGGPGTGPEMMPSRPLRFPNPRGPPGMGPAGWPQFDRNDFI